MLRKVLYNHQQKSLSATQPALTLVEMLIAVALISVLLTGLALTLLYSNRTIQEARIKSEAVNQAQSCLDNFRNLRDSNAWPAFCGYLVGWSSKFTVNDTITYNPTGTIICPQSSGNTYVLAISECGSVEKAEVTITVEYDNFSGGKGKTKASQTFQKAAFESKSNYHL